MRPSAHAEAERADQNAVDPSDPGYALVGVGSRVPVVNDVAADSSGAALIPTVTCARCPARRSPVVRAPSPSLCPCEQGPIGVKFMLISYQLRLFGIATRDVKLMSPGAQAIRTTCPPDRSRESPFRFER